MKQRIFAVAIILIMLVCLTAFTPSYEYSITTSEDFISARCGDDLEELSKKLNMSAAELDTYFNNNGLIFLAVSEDKKTQIKISAFTDNFSSAVNDIENLSDEALGEFLSAVDDSLDTTNIITNNGRKFVCIKNMRKDSGGIYTVTQYITICNNQTFYFTGYNEGQETADCISDTFKSFTLSQVSSPLPASKDYNLPLALIIIGTIAFGVIAIIMIIGIIKFIHNQPKEKTNEN